MKRNHLNDLDTGRALRILHTESSRHFAGQQLRTIKEIELFRKRGHQVWLAAGLKTAVAKMAQERGIPLLPTPIRGSFNPIVIARLTYFCLSNRINLIIAHSSRDMFNAAVVSKLTGIALIRYQHFYDRLKDSWLYRLIWRIPRQILTTSECARKLVIEQKITTPEKIQSVGTYVELDIFHPGVCPDRVRLAHGIPSDAILITQIGCIRRDKGQKVLVNAVDQILLRHPNCWFMFVGSAPNPQLKAELMEVVGSIQRPDRIIMAGYQADVASYIAASDIICLTSLSEAQPQVVPQAFAMHKLVVASNAGGIPELVQHGVNGLLYEKGKSAALAQTIEQALTLDASHIKSAAFKLAQSLDINGLMSRLEQSYTKAIT